MTDQPDTNDATVIPIHTSHDTRYPLTHFTIAVHLGVPEFTEENVVECLRRAKAFLGLYERLGQPLLHRADGTPLLVAQVDEGFIRQHIGQRSNFGYRSPRDFDEHLLNVESSITGRPRLSHRRITFLGPLKLNQPFHVYQEINDQYHSEARRVEVYPDGFLLWRQDGYHGEGPAEVEHVESENVPGLALIAERSHQRGDAVTPAEFEEMWERATGSTCGWVTKLLFKDVAQPVENAADVRCTEPRDEDAPGPYCTEHREMARRMFPALFMGS